jgi:hypothetical protein
MHWLPWLTHLADRADLGDLRTTGMVLAMGRLLTLFLGSQQDFILPQCTPTAGPHLQILCGTTLEF